MTSVLLVRGALLLSVAMLAACSQHPNGARSEPTSQSSPSPTSSEEVRVNSALRRYSALVLAMDHSGIAALFAEDGEIANEGQAPIRGRASIQGFLSAFSAYKVLENSTTPSITTVHGKTALQQGSYRQRVRTPQGGVVEVSGNFTAEWVRDSTGEWLIQRMGTRPTR